MQQNSVSFDGFNITYAVGSAAVLEQMQKVSCKMPFAEDVAEFLNSVAKGLLADREAKAFPDVVTLAFWMRKASIEGLKKRFITEDSFGIRLGRGIVFHIAPSNVPVNYAYSLVAGLLCGNRNVVRIPSKEFEQVRIVNKAFQTVLEDKPEFAPYICFVKYGHEAVINDAMSAMADVRVIWGGDNTINEIRKSPLKPRATEVTFADRYSLAVIDSDFYMKTENKAKIANDFYNDTYLTDQNACTSPRAVVWIGKSVDEAKGLFWKELANVVKEKYELSGVQAVNKLSSSFILAAVKDAVKKEPSEDNLIVRMHVPELSADLPEFKENSGYFFEYDCKDILELYEFCDDSRCQTIAYLGERTMLEPLLYSGISGVDRVVPIGKTMEFDLFWDGYDLFERLTRRIEVR